MDFAINFGIFMNEKNDPPPFGIIIIIIIPSGLVRPIKKLVLK